MSDHTLSTAIPSVQRLPAVTSLLLSARSLLTIVFLGTIFTVAARPITDPDFWWHLKTGQYIVTTSSIPHMDIFSAFHFGKEWVTHEWLSEVFIYGTFHFLGYAGLTIVFALVVTAAFAVVHQRCSRNGEHIYVSGFALMLGSIATVPTWGVRPQMFSILFASLFLKVLDGYTQKGRTRGLWWLLPLMVLWVNTHAGFALGVSLILFTIVGLVLEGFLSRDQQANSAWQRTRPLFLVLAACLAVVAINPNALRIYSYPLETVKSHGMMKYISEWWSPDFHQLMFQPFAFLILATFAAMALSPKRVSLKDLFLLLVTGWAALRSARNIPFFALVAAPLLAEHLWNWLKHGKWVNFSQPSQEGMPAHPWPKIAVNIALLVLAPSVLALARVSHTVETQPKITAEHFPVAAVEFIRNNKPSQPLYNEYGWGGYLIWTLSPDYRVYIDGRADVYGDGFLEEFLNTHDGEPGWRETLDRTGVKTVLIQPDAALASLLRLDPTWRNIYEDQRAIIFTRP